MAWHQVALVAVYLIIRVFTATPSTSIVTFGRAYCYSIYGYTRDPLFQRLKCWERELYKQVCNERERERERET
jgi:hypothetical protein